MAGVFKEAVLTAKGIACSPRHRQEDAQSN